MKTTLTLLVFFVVSTIILLNGCQQGQPVKTKPNKPVKKAYIAAKPSTKPDTLIFTDTALASLVHKTEAIFSVFDTINLNGDSYKITKLNLDKTDLNDIRASSGDSTEADSVPGFVITGVLSVKIADNLVRILKWKNIDNYDLKLLLKNHLGVVRSPDGRLYSFSFDEQTGGTYHSQVSIIHYNPGNGDSPQTFITSGDGDRAVFNKDGYDHIDTINTEQGIKYLLTGNVTGCSTCQGFYIDLVYYKKGEFIHNFNYNVGIRGGWADDNNATSVIDYDAKLHRININYDTDDLMPTCNCGKTGALEYDETHGGEFNEASKESVNCVYAFNGRSFELKRKKIKAIK